MFKLSLSHYILIGIIAVLLIFTVFRRNNSSPDQTLQQHTKDSLKVEIKKNIDSITVYYENKLKSVDSAYKANQTKIVKNDAKVIEIHKDVEKKTEVVKNWKADSLQQFFDNRYGKDTVSTDSVSLGRETAKKAIVDIIHYDAIKSENQVLNENIGLYKGQIESKDLTISIKDKQINLFETNEKNYSQALKISDQQINDLEKSVRKQKTLKKILGVFFIAATTAFAVK